jgi:uridine phosphorylase
VPARLRPTAPIAAEAILVGDPGRALLLAQELLDAPKMCNHARGLWGYTGCTTAGAELTIQSTGMGGPSAGLVLADLGELGVRRAVRVGTCTGLDPELGPGRLLVVAAARPASEGSVRDPIAPDPELTSGLQRHLGEEAVPTATVVSFDHLPRAGEPAAGAGEAADMQTATLFDQARRLGVCIAAVLVVTEAASGERVDEETEDAAAKRAGAAASALFSGST